MTFDWTTFALQLINAVILLLILRHFLFRPIANIIATRQSETQAVLDDAAQTKAAAERAKADADAAMEQTVAARAEVMQAANRDAETQRASIIAAAKTEAEKIIAQGHEDRQHQDAAAKAEMRDKLRDLSIAVARRALAAQPETPAGYVERLDTALKDLEPDTRDTLLSGANLRLISARPLDKKLSARAAEILGRSDISVQVDSDLIAGIEIASDNGVLRNSLAHDLDQISVALHDE